MARQRMSGARNWNGILSRLMMVLVSSQPISRIDRLAKNIAENTTHTRSALLMNTRGPGSMSCIWNTPTIMAVSAPPGSPRASSGIMAAPVAALLAVSEEITPSILPLPNSDRSLDQRTASL